MKSRIQNKHSILIRQLFKQRSAGDFRFWNMKGVLFLLVFSFQFNIAAQNGVVINEFASNNISKTSTVKQNLPDWIEFYNPSNQKLNLKGYNLSDDTTNLDKWTFPKFIIPPMGFAVLNLGEIVGTKKAPHFKLSKRGEVFILTNKKGIEIQRIQPIGLGYNQSYARRFDGDADFEVTDSITKGTSNNLSPGILISHQSGFYHQTFNLKLQAKTDCELRYTLNGQLPKANSPVFPDYLEIKKKKNSPNDIAKMRVSYKPVKMEEYNPKGTILRVACFKNGKQVSKVYNRTFIVLDEKDRHYDGLDVICLVTEKDNLFAKDSGIYASGGLMRLNKPNANFYQRGRAWEKPANITLIEQDGNIAFSHSIGIRLHGGKTRKNAQKSFRLYSRSKYGAPAINYDFFKAGNATQHKKLILRAANSSWGLRYMADDVIAEVCKPLAVDVLDSHPVLLYLNGEFWGIYSMREYFDDEFLKTHHKVSRKELSIAYHGVGYRPNVDKGWGIIKGETKDLTNLYHFLAFKDSLFDRDYEHVKTVLNMQSIIDYYCVEIYFNNRDWPTNNNKLWKVKEGKWNQVLYDMDACFSRLSENTFRRILKPDGKRQNAPYATLLFRKLVTSPQFLKEFTGRMEDLMNDELASYKIIACIDRYAKLYRNVIHQHCNRYSEPINKIAWESQMQLMRQFAKQRKGAIRKFMREEFPQAY